MATATIIADQDAVVAEVFSVTEVATNRD